MDRIEMEALKERIDVAKVVGSYLTLEKRGAAYWGLCPFHDDHHPSLRVDPAKGLYHCFSCKAGGDAIGFVREKESCGFMEAINICADICRLSVPAIDTRRQNDCRDKRSAEADRLPAVSPAEKEQQADAIIAANEAFMRTLLPYDPGMEELRGVYASFGVGMAPAMVPEAFRFTRQRIVFPIHNHEGRPVAFAARYCGDLPAGKIPKYLNSATGPVYKKDELLYGWHKAQAEVRLTGVVFLTEGYKDTLAMHAAGFSNTVALCGTNLSEQHIRLIARRAATVCLFLDADQVGRATAEEAAVRLRKAGLKVIDLLPEGGKDADELIRVMGRQAFAGWVRQRAVAAEIREAGMLLVAACRRWPDTCCLTAEGEELLYNGYINRLLADEGFLPQGSLLPSPSGEALQPQSVVEKLDRLYALRSNQAHSPRVRCSELIRYLLLCYLEACLSERIRRQAHGIARTPIDKEEQRLQLLSSLQYDRNYLNMVSHELGRR